MFLSTRHKIILSYSNVIVTAYEVMRDTKITNAIQNYVKY